MRKSRFLTLRLESVHHSALEARASALGRSVPEHIRHLLKSTREWDDPLWLWVLAYDIVQAAVAIHHLVIVTGGREDLTGIIRETRRIARAMEVHDVRK